MAVRVITSINMKKYIILLGMFLTGIIACKDDEPIVPAEGGDDLTSIAFNPTAYNLVIPPGFPSMEIPADNPLTEEGVDLGRLLFYDPILSSDSTVSCGSCHSPAGSFTDNLALSPGVGKQLGNRSTMAIVNIGFMSKGFFWDGRSPTLEEQALHPVENPVEMAETWENAEVKLQRHKDYPQLFRKAFGIKKTGEITRELATKAIAQFERTLISGNSRFDKKRYQNDPDPFLFSDLEVDGLKIYFDDQFSETAKGHCAHCHDGGPLLTSERYENNGITQVNSLTDFPDKGLGMVTGKQTDNGKFKAPTLRNIALTAPYMHDGRFNTLEEVIEHYNSGGHFADNVLLGSITPLHLTEYDKKALLAFLHTFTDTSFVNNPAFQNPYE